MKFLFLYLFISSFAAADNLSDHRVGFKKSMNNFEFHDENYASKDTAWLLAQKLYNDNFLKNLHYSPAPTIPLIIHHIWVGSDLPEYVKKFRASWIEKNPSWTFILWTDHPKQEYGDLVLNSFSELKSYLATPNKKQFIVMDMNKVKLKNSEAYIKKAKNYGEMSDILRYEALYHIGGLYVDTDFECLKPFNDFHHCCDFYTGISYTKEFVLYNGLIGSKPGNNILKKAIKGLSNRKHRGDSQHYSGPYYFTECFLKGAAKSPNRVVAFPVTFFYPWPNYQRHQTFAEAKGWIAPESYALHYWKVSWNTPEGSKAEAK